MPEFQERATGQQEITPKRIVKIEARPAQEIIDDWYMGAPDYSWAEDLEQDPYYLKYQSEEAEELEKWIGGPLDYEPFDVKEELSSLRNPQRESSLRDKVHRTRKMQEIRDSLSLQTLGLATTIRDL